MVPFLNHSVLHGAIPQDYFHVIQSPMDLGTVLVQLHAGLYTHFIQVLDHILVRP